MVEYTLAHLLAGDEFLGEGSHGVEVRVISRREKIDERGQDVTAKQRLHLFNSTRLHGQISRIVAPPKLPDGQPHPIYRLPFPKRVSDLYWRILARSATPRERELIVGLWQKRGGGKKNYKSSNLLRDVAWCLVNSKEFLFRT